VPPSYLSPSPVHGRTRPTAVTSEQVEPVGYGPLLDAVKQGIAGARLRAARAVTADLIEMYWRIGRLVLDRQADEGWGTRVIDRLATDLRTASRTSRPASGTPPAPPAPALPRLPAVNAG
jgi:hypothetical protein